MSQRFPDESSKAYAAFCAYRDLGPERSLEKVAQKCSKSVSLLARWSSRYQWVKRVEADEDELERIKEAARKAEIDRIMSEGFAQTHIRVKYLNKLAKRQWKDMQDTGLVWLPDVKQIGSGEDAERVDLIRYNAGLDEQFRSTLDDIAKETGGRTKKTETKITVLPKVYIGLEELEAEDGEEESSQGKASSK